MKNVFVLAPMFLFGKLFDPSMVLSSLLVFFLFCLASSVGYLVNDCEDKDEDAKHPDKRKRPIASGELSKDVACDVAFLLFLFCTSVAGMLQDKSLLPLMICYLAMSLCYSKWGKKVKWLDVGLVAMCFVLRVMAGTSAIGESQDLLLLTVAFTLVVFIVLCKRHHDASCSKVATMYSISFLDPAVMFFAIVTIVTYGVYVYATAIAITWAVFVYGIIRYLKLTYLDEASDPTFTILTDFRLLLAGVVWLSLSSWLIYG